MNRLLQTQRRKFRTRNKLKRPVATERLRLSVFRSGKHIYAQVIDDAKGITVAEANSKTLAPAGDKTSQAKAVGQAVAEKAKAAGAQNVVFDRGGYRYHGRIKALADGAREGGLNF